VIKDRTEGTGRFNFSAGAMATVQGVGAALSAALGGPLIQKWGFNASFAGLAVIGAVAASLLWCKVPETRKEDPVETSLGIPQASPFPHCLLKTLE
jgi:MFS family permease